MSFSRAGLDRDRSRGGRRAPLSTLSSSPWGNSCAIVSASTLSSGMTRVDALLKRDRAPAVRSTAKSRLRSGANNDARTARAATTATATTTAATGGARGRTSSTTRTTTSSAFRSSADDDVGVRSRAMAEMLKATLTTGRTHNRFRDGYRWRFPSPPSSPPPSENGSNLYELSDDDDDDDDDTDTDARAEYDSYPRGALPPTPSAASAFNLTPTTPTTPPPPTTTPPTFVSSPRARRAW